MVGMNRRPPSNDVGQWPEMLRVLCGGGRSTSRWHLSTAASLRGHAAGGSTTSVVDRVQLPPEPGSRPRRQPSTPWVETGPGRSAPPGCSGEGNGTTSGSPSAPPPPPGGVLAVALAAGRWLGAGPGHPPCGHRRRGRGGRSLEGLRTSWPRRGGPPVAPERGNGGRLTEAEAFRARIAAEAGVFG